MIKRQGRQARRLDMQPKAFLLHGLAFGGVVIVETGFPNPHEFRVFGQSDKILDRRHRFLSGTHRVSACGVEHRGIGLGNGANLRFAAASGCRS